MVARRSRAEPLKLRRPGGLISVTLVALVTIAAFGFGRTAGEMRDFEVYWTAASRAGDAAPLYRAEDGHYQFKYLPAFAVITSPAAAAPIQAAKRGWFVASVALLCALLALCTAILPVHHRHPAWLVVVMVAVMGKFYGHELVLGQVNLLFAVLAAGGILLLTRHEVSAGTLLFVTAVVVKPYAVIFAPWLLWLHGYRALLTLAAGTIIVLVVPLPLYGVAGTVALHMDWWHTVMASTAPNLTNADNVSLAGFWAKWIGQGPLAQWFTVASSAAALVLAAIVVVRGHGIRGREALDGSVLLILIPLLSPQGWDYVFLVATPAVALLANFARALPAAARRVTYLAMATIGLSLFDLMGRERYAAFMAWSVITICFVVLLLALAELRRRRIA